MGLFMIQVFIYKNRWGMVVSIGLWQTPVLDDHQLNGTDPQSIKGTVLAEALCGFPRLYLIRVPKRSQRFFLQE